MKSLYRLASATLAALCLAGSSACIDVNKIAANQAAELAEAGALGITGFWDYQIAGAATPNLIVQGEVLVEVSPNNEDLLLGLAKTYVSYAFGWVQDEWEVADDAGKFELADQLEHRVMLLYRRAAELSLRAMRMRDDEGKLDETLKTGKVELVRAYIKRVYTDQDDVAALFYAGLAWGSAMANSGGDLKELANAPIARSLLERSVELDPTFSDAGGLAVLGTVEAVFPELFGGDMKKSQELYERALTLSKRRNHLVLVAYARNYAVNAQDRALFLRLVKEILAAPDLGPDVRLTNKVARHRAERYLRKVDDWFEPALAPLEEEPLSPEPPPAEAAPAAAPAVPAES